MSPLCVLLMAASATAADPLPMSQGTTTPAPAYSSSEPTDGGRPRLFSRIRKFFRRESQPSDQLSATTYPASPGGPSVRENTTPAPGTSSGPAAPVPVRPVPLLPPREMDPTRRPPIGSPF